MAEKEGFWFTAHGRHIYAGAGESKEDAINRTFKSEESQKEREIAKAKANADKLNKEDEYKHQLAQGNKVSISKDGKLMFHGKELNELKTKDATPPNSRYPEGDSLYKNMKNGQLTPERLELHRQIIENYFKGHNPYAPDQEKTALFTGGGGASGKGALTRDIEGYYSRNDNPLIVDPDYIKVRLSEADGVSPRDFNAGYYHEESSALAKQIFSTALQNNYPVMFDGTHTGVGSTLAKLDEAASYGYSTKMNFIVADYKTIEMNSIDRYAKGDTNGVHRLVDIVTLTQAHQSAVNAVDKLQDKFDSFRLWDNSGRKMVEIGSQTGGKPLTIMNQSAYTRFLNQAEEFTLSIQDVAEYNAKAEAALEEHLKRGGK